VLLGVFCGPVVNVLDQQS